MASPASHDWYLHDWFASAGLTQNALVLKLDYPKNTAHRLWHGLQPYRRDHVEDISSLLNIKPHELLMHPDDAMRIRRLEAVIAEVPRAETPEVPGAQRRTGTAG